MMPTMTVVRASRLTLTALLAMALFPDQVFGLLVPSPLSNIKRFNLQVSKTSLSSPRATFGRQYAKASALFDKIGSSNGEESSNQGYRDVSNSTISIDTAKLSSNTLTPLESSSSVNDAILSLQSQQQDWKSLLTSIQALQSQLNVTASKSQSTALAMDTTTSGSTESSNDIVQGTATPPTLVNKDNWESTFATIKTQVTELHDKASLLQSQSDLLPPVGLATMQEYTDAIALWIRLPLRVRLAICILIDNSGKQLEEYKLFNALEACQDWEQVPEVVAAWVGAQGEWADEEIQEALDIARRLILFKGDGRMDSLLQEAYATANVQKDGRSFGLDATKDNKEKSGGAYSIFSSDNKLVREETQYDGIAEQILARVTRKEGSKVTRQDMNVLLKVLNRKTFVVSRAEEIPGGYLIRGTNSLKNGTSLLAVIDKELPADYKCQVTYMYDFTFENDPGDRAPILLLLNKDLSPTSSPWLRLGSTVAALVSTYVFCISMFGMNPTLSAKLQEVTSDGDFTGLAFFNERVLELAIPILFVQALQSSSQFTVAALERIKTGTPTLLPFWGLPLLGSVTSIQESPKNFQSLFNFAIVGPTVGLLSSAALLWFGLQQTAVADPSVYEMFPSVSANFLQQSTLGATIVDTILAGGKGYLYRPVDPASALEPIPLHPFALAGFVGLMISALDLLPFGSTSGGRISVSILGRQGHSIMGGLVWFSLILVTLFMEHSNTLLFAWVAYNIVQNDPEIPCREETEPVNILCGLVALGLWFTAILTLVPIS
jgi:hypothetical protein